MRRFELILAFAAVFAVAWPALFGIRPRRGIVAVVLTSTFVLQFQLEGFRWQMVPLYALAVGLAIGDVFFLDRELKWSNRIARGLFGMTGVALATALAIVMPVPKLPVPSGPHAIGTFTVELVDAERVELYGASPGGPRRLVVQVWYPASATSAQEAFVPWTIDWEVVAPELARNLGFPSWFLNHTQYTQSHASDKPPIADGAFPVVVYSHGWTGFRTIAVNQVETLVSNGYIVIAPDHTFGAVATRFADGEVITYDPAALPDEEEIGEEAYLLAAADLVSTFAADIVTVLNALDEGESGPFRRLAESVDLTRIGLYGHSTGGGAAVQVCLEDERCDAVLGMDPWVEPLPDKVIKIRATRPSLYMRSDGWRGNDNDAILMGIAGRSLEVSYVLGIEGADHNDFTVTPLLSPIASQLGMKGPIPAGRIIPIIDNYLLGFFDVFLLGTGPAALDTVGFEEVTVEIFNR